eukprot:1605791-Alexandrium_andersonii.AAC.1
MLHVPGVRVEQATGGGGQARGHAAEAEAVDPQEGGQRDQVAHPQSVQAGRPASSAGEGARSARDRRGRRGHGWHRGDECGGQALEVPQDRRPHAGVGRRGRGQSRGGQDREAEGRGHVGAQEVQHRRVVRGP